MKTKTNMILAVSVALTLVSAVCASAEVAVSYRSGRSGRVKDPDVLSISFERILDPYGTWVYSADYGRVWQPSTAKIDRTWRPYCDAGKWLWTSKGWYWESDYAWGDIAFHYGRWAQSSRYGWIWVPGTDWSGAWVSWRDTSTHNSWAPLPPEAGYQAGIGLTYNGKKVSVGFHFGLTDWHYVSVPTGYMTAANFASIVVTPGYRTTYYPSTVVYTTPTYRTYSHDRYAYYHDNRYSHKQNRKPHRKPYKSNHQKNNYRKPAVQKQTHSYDRVTVKKPSRSAPSKTVYNTKGQRPQRTEQRVTKTTYKQSSPKVTKSSSSSSSRSDSLRNIAFKKLR